MNCTIPKLISSAFRQKEHICRPMLVLQQKYDCMHPGILSDILLSAVLHRPHCVISVEESGNVSETYSLSPQRQFGISKESRVSQGRKKQLSCSERTSDHVNGNDTHVRIYSIDFGTIWLGVDLFQYVRMLIFN